jgi:hypothetical protein
MEGTMLGTTIIIAGSDASWQWAKEQSIQDLEMVKDGIRSGTPYDDVPSAHEETGQVHNCPFDYIWDIDV